MFNITKNKNLNERTLYDNILTLSRNKLFFTKFDLADTFQNRIYLIFVHISFLFVKIRHDQENKKYKIFYQNMFDLVFNNIELNMRENGYGDTIINKNMKSLVKNFYNILLFCESFNSSNSNDKLIFFSKYLAHNNTDKNENIVNLIDYFDKYQSFCFDLNSDSVLSGNLNFNYK